VSLLHDLPPRIAANLLTGVIAKGPAGGVYLTFDDGPDPRTTPDFLDCLAQFGCQATFFLTGSKVSANVDVVRSIAKAGHTIGSHGFNHVSLLRANCNRLKIEVVASLDAIESAIGIRPILFRPPYGRIGTTGCSVTRQLGLTTVLWSLSGADWKVESAEHLASAILTKVGDGDIILLHDSGKNAEVTLRALPAIIDGIRSKGFTIAPLTGNLL